MSMPKTGSALTRRATLKGAGLAVGTLWVVPVVQVISMSSAAAASAPPPGPSLSRSRRPAAPALTEARHPSELRRGLVQNGAARVE